MKEKMPPVNIGLTQWATCVMADTQMRPISNILFRGQVTFGV